MDLLSCQSIVIKIGSALLVDESGACLNEVWLKSLIEDVLSLTQQGIKVIIVSSGAMACGRFSLALGKKQLSLDSKQAISAVGQIELMHHYQALLNQHQLKAAQVLLTLEDTESRARYINLRNTLKKLLEMSIIPIINENDSVATEEIRYGDNDRLAARVAQIVDADALILLSDIDGFYTDDPRINPKAEIMPLVEHLTPEILAMAKGSSTNYGSGGMRTKLDAAQIATGSGCNMLITLGKPLNPIKRFLTSNKGTWFKSTITHKKAKKIWLQQHLKLSGAVVIDKGAVAALKKGSSLLPVGIAAVNGHFGKGTVVTIITDDHLEIARGIVSYSSQDLKQIIGKSSKEIEAILGYYGCDEAIHRDNLVIL